MVTKQHKPQPDPASEAGQPDAWVRWAWIWSVFFYLFLVIPLIWALQESWVSAVQKVWLVGFSLLFGAVHWLGAIQLPRWNPCIRTRPLLLLIYLIILAVVWSILVSMHPVFYFALGGLFSQLYFWLPWRWAVITNIVLVILFGIQHVEDPTFIRANWWVWVLATIGAAMVGLWIEAIIHQSEQRKVLLRRLEDAQADLVAAEHHAGMLAERQRLAHEIHDTLAQGFISIVTHLEAAELALPSGHELVQRHLDQARQTARDSLEQTRRVVQALRPEPLEDASLAEAIQRVTTRWSDDNSIPAQATITGTPQALPPEVEVSLLRATQEALTNVRKHANASQVTVTLSYMPDLVLLDVQDDGRGLNGTPMKQPGPVNGGFGLVAMRERIEQLGGSLSLESEDDEGTTVVIEVPLGGNI